jgi:hypothetical protein
MAGRFRPGALRDDRIRKNALSGRGARGRQRRPGAFGVSARHPTWPAAVPLTMPHPAPPATAAAGTAALLPRRGHRCQQPRSRRVPPPAQRAERRPLPTSDSLSQLQFAWPQPLCRGAPSCRFKLGGGMDRSLTAAVSLLILVFSVYAQSAPTSLQGRVLYPDGSPVPNAPIQLRHKPGDAIARTRSDANGVYRFTGLADGKWDFTIRMPCCAYAAVAREVDIASEKPQQLDVSLVETLNGSTLGDDPARNAEAMRKRQRVRSGPAPRTATGVPDLSGVWLLTDDPYPEEPQLLPSAEALAMALAKAPRNAPHNRCLPGPPPLPGASSPFIAKLVQSP